MKDLLITCFGPGVVCPVCGLGPGEDPMSAWFCYGAQLAGVGQLLTRCERCRANFTVDLTDETCDLIHQPQRAKVGGVFKTVLQWRVHNGNEDSEEKGAARPG